MKSQRAELDELKEDMLKINLDTTSVDKTLEGAEVRLEEAIAQTPDVDVELDYVVEQFSSYIVAVQEWGAWFCPALATIEWCRGAYQNRSCVEDMNDKLQVGFIKLFCECSRSLLQSDLSKRELLISYSRYFLTTWTRMISSLGKFTAKATLCSRLFLV